MADMAELKAEAQRVRGRKVWQEFLETKPAYASDTIHHVLDETRPYPNVQVSVLRFPRIQIHCEKCDGPRGFDTKASALETRDTTTIVTYTCRDCGHWCKTFALVVNFGDDGGVTVMKLGEFPPYGSHVAKRLQKMLTPEDLNLYRKGMRAEREGQGIGAAAYFRRVVENQWKDLVTKLRDAAKTLGTPEQRLTVFDDALKQTQFSAAVEMLRDAIPPKLLILDGRNPLTLLYRPLSVQLHDLSDEQCLQQAADIRLVLNELFDNIGRVLRDEEELRGAVNRLQGL